MSMLKRLLITLFWSLSYITLKVGSFVKSKLRSLQHAMAVARLYAVVLRLDALESPSYILLRDDNAELERGPGQDSSALILKEIGILKEECVGLKREMTQTQSKLENLSFMVESVKNPADNGNKGALCVPDSGLSRAEEEARVKFSDPEARGNFARLQNSYLESCIFPKTTSVSRDVSGLRDGIAEDCNHAETTDDSIIIITETEASVSSITQECVSPTNPSIVTVASDFCDHHTLTQQKKPTGTTLKDGANSNQYPVSPEINPIPVHITTRPSLPPKFPTSTRLSVSSSPTRHKNSCSTTGKSKLRPLLLAARFTTAASGSVRRKLAAKKSNINIKCNEASKIKSPEKKAHGSKEKIDHPISGMRHDTHVSSAKDNAKLNPCAPVFMPGTITTQQVQNLPLVNKGSVTDKNTNNNDQQARAPHTNGHYSAALSPSLSPFLCISPSPNSPFVRPAPARRQSEDGYTRKSAAIPIRAPHEKQDAIDKPAEDERKRKTETRASSLSLIRERAAKREAARASGTSNPPTPILPDPALAVNKMSGVPTAGIGLTTSIFPSSSSGLGFDLQSVESVSAATSVKNTMKLNARPRLEGKGLPSIASRRALEELSNLISKTNMLVEDESEVVKSTQQDSAGCISRELGTIQSADSKSRLGCWASQ